jgi:type VI secretion system protein ImpE
VSVSALFQAGRLSAAIDALSGDLRADPLNVRQRTFLFELLCFAGEFERAEKHLDFLGAGTPEAALGALLYRSALHAERLRQRMFAAGEVPPPPPHPPVPGVVNGRRFGALSDADPRIGARLEVFAAGQYTLIPFEQLASVQLQEPRRLRDLLWAPAAVQPGPALKGLELGEVLIPALAPLSWRSPDDTVRLGRATEWEEDEGTGAHPVGQKLLLADDEEPIPFLELRTIEFGGADNG